MQLLRWLSWTKLIAYSKSLVWPKHKLHGPLFFLNELPAFLQIFQTEEKEKHPPPPQKKTNKKTKQQKTPTQTNHQ